MVVYAHVMIGMVIFIVSAAVVLEAIFGRENIYSKNSENALEILKKRYARGEIGIVIGDKDNWGKDYSTEAIKLFLNIIFSEMNLNKASIQVFSYNQRAIKCYKKKWIQEIGIA